MVVWPLRLVSLDDEVYCGGRTQIIFSLLVCCYLLTITAVMGAMEVLKHFFSIFVHLASVPQHQLRNQEFHIVCVLDGESSLYKFWHGLLLAIT